MKHDTKVVVFDAKLLVMQHRYLEQNCINTGYLPPREG